MTSEHLNPLLFDKNQKQNKLASVLFLSLYEGCDDVANLSQ